MSKKYNAVYLAMSLILTGGSVFAQDLSTEHELDKQIEVVSIFGQRNQLETATGSASVLNQDTLEQFEFDDIHRVLQSVPGVYVREEDGFGLRPNIGLRGATTERSSKVAIMEDGVLIAPAPYAAPAAYYFPLVSRMSQVEVFKGPSAILYGPNTVGGAINMVSRPIPNQYMPGRSGGVDLSAGEFGYKKVHGYYSLGLGETSFLLEGGHIGSDGFKELADDKDTGFEKNEVLFKASYVPSDSKFEQFISFKAGFSNEESRETYLGLTDEGFSNNPYHRYAASKNDLMDWEHYQFQLSHYIEFNDDTTLYTQVYHREFDRDWDRLSGFASSRTMQTILTLPERGLNASFMQVLDGSRDSLSGSENLVFTNNDRRYVSQGFETKLSSQQTFWYMDLTLDAGLRIHRDEVKRNHQAEYLAMSSGTLVETDIADEQVTLNKDVAKAIATYVNTKLEYGYWTASAGLRMEFIEGEHNNLMNGEKQENRDTVLLPGVGLFYKLNADSGLLFGVNKGFVPNSPGQEEGVDPEESWNYELGYRYSRAEIQGEFIGFFNDYRNLKGSCTLSSGYCKTLDQEFNGGEVDIYGLEASLSQTFELDSGFSLPTKLTYTHTQSEFQTGFRSEFSQWGHVKVGDELPYLPEHQMSFEFGIEGDNWRVMSLIKFVSAMAEAAGDDTELSGFETDELVQLDLSASYQYNNKIKFYGKVDNVTDELTIVSRRPFGARPNKPRQASVGVKYEF